MRYRYRSLSSDSCLRCCGFTEPQANSRRIAQKSIVPAPFRVADSVNPRPSREADFQSPRRLGGQCPLPGEAVNWKSRQVADDFFQLSNPLLRSESGLRSEPWAPHQATWFGLRGSSARYIVEMTRERTPSSTQIGDTFRDLVCELLRTRFFDAQPVQFSRHLPRRRCGVEWPVQVVEQSTRSPRTQ